MTNRHERRKQMATGGNFTGEFSKIMQEPLMMQLIIAALLRKLGGSAVIAADELEARGLVMSSVDRDTGIHMHVDDGANISQAGNA